MSKGSRQRPVDKSKFDESFDRIFGKPKDFDRFETGVPRVERRPSDDGKADVNRR